MANFDSPLRSSLGHILPFRSVEVQKRIPDLQLEDLLEAELGAE